MQKETVSIYVVSHKPIQLLTNDEAYHLIQAGASTHEKFCALTDDSYQGNISYKNESWCELTAAHWIWKNATSDIVGLCHYRRYFTTRTGWIIKCLTGINTCILSTRKIRLLMRKYDAIVTQTERSDIPIGPRYARGHIGKDMTTTRQVLMEMHPCYIPAFDQVMSGYYYDFANMIITRREVYQKYCSWLFPLLEEIERRTDLTGYSSYQMRVFGFLAERLQRVWMLTNGIKIKRMPIIQTEDSNCFTRIWREHNEKRKKP